MSERCGFHGDQSAEETCPLCGATISCCRRVKHIREECSGGVPGE